MGTCLTVLPAAEPWAGVVVPDMCRLAATFFHGIDPHPTGITPHEMEAADHAHVPTDGPGGGSPVVWLEVPRQDAARLLLVVDQVLDHPAYQRWLKMGGATGGDFQADLYAEGERVLISGPMQSAVEHRVRDLDEGEPPYTHAWLVVGYDVLADLRRALAEVT